MSQRNTNSQSIHCIKKIIHQAQDCTANHNKLIVLLTKLYEKHEPEEFLNAFICILRELFHHVANNDSKFMQRALDFCAKFTINLVNNSCKKQIEELNGSGSEMDMSIDISSNPFLRRTFMNSLEFHDSALLHERYYSCYFTMLLLKYLGGDAQLDSDFCDRLQEAMLERLSDAKPVVRIQAVRSLTRLQEPTNSDCPVIRGYLEHMLDGSASVRKSVIEEIAPTSLAIMKIKERAIYDTEPIVRKAAFARLADINPATCFKIEDRRNILFAGFFGQNKTAQASFTEKLLPKWLTFYDGNYVFLLSSIQNDMDDESFKCTLLLSEKIMDVFLRERPITEIIQYICLNDERVVSLDKLKVEVALLWSLTAKHLKTIEEAEPLYEKILPELSGLSHYIESVMENYKKKKIDENDYHRLLTILFELTGLYDSSDEIGEKTFYSMIRRNLLSRKIPSKLVPNVLKIAANLSHSADVFASDMCYVISEIHQPLMENEPTPEELREKEFKLAQLQAKKNILDIDKEQAVENKDYAKAQIIVSELVKVTEELKNLEKCVQCPPDAPKDDSTTLCYCLDVLIGTLQSRKVNYLLPCLRTCKDEFLTPLFSNTDDDVHYRVFKTLFMLSIIDRDTAKETAGTICYLLRSYKRYTEYKRDMVILAVQAAVDLIRLYTIKIFIGDSESSSVASQSSNKRRLYTTENLEELCVLEQNTINGEQFLDLLVDMLDDDNADIKHNALLNLATLITNDFPTHDSVIVALILKWLNPNTEKNDRNFSKFLSVLIGQYASCSSQGVRVIKKAILPILRSIANAPASSPLSQVDVDSTLRFLSALTNAEIQQVLKTPRCFYKYLLRRDLVSLFNIIGGCTINLFSRCYANKLHRSQNPTNIPANPNSRPKLQLEDGIRIHNRLAQTLLTSMLNKPMDNAVGHIIRMLNFLQISTEDKANITEMINQGELLLTHLSDKTPQNNLKKFIQKLKTVLEGMTNEEREESNSSKMPKSCTFNENDSSQNEPSMSSTNNDQIPISDANKDHQFKIPEVPKEHAFKPPKKKLRPENDLSSNVEIKHNEQISDNGKPEELLHNEIGNDRIKVISENFNHKNETNKTEEKSKPQTSIDEPLNVRRSRRKTRSDGIISKNVAHVTSLKKSLGSHNGSKVNIHKSSSSVNKPAEKTNDQNTSLNDTMIKIIYGEKILSTDTNQTPNNVKPKNTRNTKSSDLTKQSELNRSSSNSSKFDDSSELKTRTKSGNKIIKKKNAINNAKVLSNKSQREKLRLVHPRSSKSTSDEELIGRKKKLVKADSQDKTQWVLQKKQFVVNSKSQNRKQNNSVPQVSSKKSLEKITDSDNDGTIANNTSTSSTLTKQLAVKLPNKRFVTAKNEIKKYETKASSKSSPKKEPFIKLTKMSNEKHSEKNDTDNNSAIVNTRFRKPKLQPLVVLPKLSVKSKIQEIEKLDNECKIARDKTPSGTPKKPVSFFAMKTRSSLIKTRESNKSKNLTACLQREASNTGRKSPKRRPSKRQNLFSPASRSPKAPKLNAHSPLRKSSTPKKVSDSHLAQRNNLSSLQKEILDLEKLSPIPNVEQKSDTVRSERVLSELKLGNEKHHHKKLFVSNHLETRTRSVAKAERTKEIKSDQRKVVILSSVVLRSKSRQRMGKQLKCSVQTKRKKKRAKTLPNLDNSVESNSTMLHRIMERSIEQKSFNDDDMTIHDSFDSSNSSKKENLSTNVSSYLKSKTKIKAASRRSSRKKIEVLVMSDSSSDTEGARTQNLKRQTKRKCFEIVK